MTDESNNLPPEGLRALIDLASEGACLVDPRSWRVVYANPQFGGIAAAPGNSSVGQRIFDLVPPLAKDAARAAIDGLGDGRCSEVRIDLSSESAVLDRSLADVRGRRIETADGPLLALVFGRPSMSHPANLRRDVGFDSLTGLADRRQILDRLATLLRGERRHDEACAVLFVDVDGFKQVNDAYGHLVGDRVLGEVARRLAATVRAADHLARFGGDEFLVLVERISSRGEIAAIVRRIQAAFVRPISLPQGDVTLGVSVGAARAGEDGNSPEELIDAADRAMYAAKRAAI